MDADIVCNTLYALKEARKFSDMSMFRDLTVLIANDCETNILHGPCKTNSVPILIHQAFRTRTAITKSTKPSLFFHLGLTQGAMNDCL
jgi:hypothetical protein